MRSHQPSAIEPDEEVLHDEDQYRRDVAGCVQLSREQQQALVERARAGDSQAREAIILACYPYSEAVARKYARTYAWASARLDALDLMQEGITRAMECLDKALAHPHPFGYLWKAIHGVIVTYCQRWCSPIKAVETHEGSFLPGVVVLSLDVPLSSNPDEVLANVIEDTSLSAFAERDFTLLYEAIETLVPRQRDAVTRYYGIGCAPEPYEAIGVSWGIENRPGSYASTYERRGVVALRNQLEPVYELAS